MRRLSSEEDHFKSVLQQESQPGGVKKLKHRTEFFEEDRLLI